MGILITGLGLGSANVFASSRVEAVGGMNEDEEGHGTERGSQRIGVVKLIVNNEE